MCIRDRPVTDAISIYAVKLIGDNIIKAANDRDKDAMEEVMLASMLAGIAFGNEDTAAAVSYTHLCDSGSYT